MMYEIKNSAESSDTLDIYIYSDVSKSWWDEEAMSATKFRKELEKNKNASQINLYINSMGGSVSEGVAIFNQLQRYKDKVTAYIDGFACSIASVIPMAASKIVMSETAMLMIHNPWTFAMGNSKDMRKTADDLDKIREGCIIPAYKAKCGDKLTDEKLIEMLDNETFINSAEALEYGFCDEVVPVSDEEKKEEAADKVQEEYDAAKAEIMNNMELRFGEMVAKLKSHGNMSAPVPKAAEIAKNSAEKQQEETHDSVSEPDVSDKNDAKTEINDANAGINDVNAKAESEPEKAEETSKPVEDKVKANELFMKLLKGEM